MSSITAIVTAYRRPHALEPLIAAVRAQSEPPAAVWAWANEPSAEISALLQQSKLDRVVSSSDNAFFHGRFALALLAPSEYVAIFDDDSIPGENWFRNCLDTMAIKPGILGAAGIVLHGPGYAARTMHGWQRPSDAAIEVDLVGQAWFLRTEWVRYLFSAPPVTGRNGEDIELAARAWRVAGIGSYCPPHPAGDKSRWGSTRGLELGDDDCASSRRAEHYAERNEIVAAEMAAGWKPLFLRTGQAAVQAAEIASEPAQTPNSANGALAAERDASHAERKQAARDSLLLASIPKSARTVLAVGCGAGSYLRKLKSEKGCEVVALEADEQAAAEAKRHVDRVLGGAFEDTLAELEGAFDCIICDRALEKLRSPRRFLQRLCERLSPAGALVALVGNARHRERVAALVCGRWDEEEPYQNPSPQIRHFTRREIEKLFYRGGFAVEELEPRFNAALDVWRRRGKPLDIDIEALEFTARSQAEAEEFYAEEFLVKAKPDGRPMRGLTSIVIATHNQLAYTRQCLESIRFYTDEPYELILVDNGSSDGTPEYLRSCSDVRLIANAENRGFPAAANQGIAASRGEQVLLLNNDVVVTTGWLDRLIGALESAPDIGLAGPSANFVSGPQQVPAPYEDLASLDGFAWDWGRDHDGQREAAKRLVGFCLLIRRAVIDEIGLLDERFGLGNFEDDDYCLRALRAGYRAVIARDAFVHHFGHRTFAGAGIDLNSLLEHNAGRFREKWENAEPAGQESRGAGGHSGVSSQNPVPAVPAPLAAAEQPASEASPLAQHASQPQLSLCMIVRDNERTIRSCLESIKPWVDEMIVVDTGSTDATPAIAEELGARVYHFPWPDSFSIARNESLKYARGEWLFWMDSDDVIDRENGRKLRELAGRNHEPNLLGYVMQVHCPGAGAAGAHDVTVVDHLKLFRNRPDLRFEGRIHEQLLDAINRAGGEVAFTDVFVVHAGADHSPEGRKRKLKRDLKLLHFDRRERPKHPFVYFNLGMTYADAGKHRQAIQALRRSLELSQPHESQVRKAYALLTASFRELGQKAEARQACAEGLKLCPKDPELLFRNAMLLHEDGRLRAAELSYLAALANDDNLHFSSIDRGIVGFKARHNLAVVYADMGALHKAEAQWQRIVAEAPGYQDGWRGLIENLLLQNNRTGAAQSLERIPAADPSSRSFRLTLQARIAEHSGDIGAARELLDSARRECPDDLDLLQEKCRLLFYQAELDELEDALSELVRRQPDDAAAHHNLGTVFVRRGRHDKAVEAFRASLKHRPDSALTHLSLGYALRGAGALRDAETAFEQCLRLSPPQPVVEEAKRQLAATIA